MKQKRKQEIIASLKMCVDLKEQDIEDYLEKLRKIGNELIQNQNINLLGKIFNILGNNIRLRILKILEQKDYCVCELEAILDKSQAAISHHLKILESAGIIRGIKRGYFTHYELIREELTKYLDVFNEEYLNLK